MSNRRAIQFAISGQLDFYFGPIISALPYIAAGKVSALAVSGTTRAAKLPQLPTMAEAALPGFEMSGWYSIFVPASTPSELAKHLASEIERCRRIVRLAGVVPQ